MKKVSLFILIAISMSAYGFSQDTVRIKYGLFAGANVSQIHTTVPGSGSAYSANKVGLNFGILVEVPFSSYFAIQPELSFSQLGWNVTERLYLDSLTLNNPKYNLNYISLPILIKFKVAPTVKNGNGLALYAGPQVGYLAGANLTADNASGSQSIKDGFGSFDFSGIAGAEYFMPMGIGISVRYQLGFSNIFSKEAVDEFYQIYGSDVTVKNHALTVTFGYRF